MKKGDHGSSDHDFSASMEGSETGRCKEELIAESSKPRLLVDLNNPDLTAAALRDILKNSSCLYERGVPVQLVRDQLQDGWIAREMTAEDIILLAHRVCRPWRYRKQQDGSIIEEDTRLPHLIAKLYLRMLGERDLPALDGITSAPLLADDGQIRSADGYDETSRMWCENQPDLTGLIPERPTEEEAGEALLIVRKAFRTFCFADAEMVDGEEGVRVVDLTKPPGRDEFCIPDRDVDPGLPTELAPSASRLGSRPIIVGRRRWERPVGAVHLLPCVRARTVCCHGRCEWRGAGQTYCSGTYRGQLDLVPRQP